MDARVIFRRFQDDQAQTNTKKVDYTKHIEASADRPLSSSRDLIHKHPQTSIALIVWGLNTSAVKGDDTQSCILLHVP